MRIAIPMVNGAISMHFGHCNSFAFVDVENNEITGINEMIPPPHEPGLFPAWVAQQGATLVIAGGMGSRAQSLFVQNGVQVVVGANGADTREVVRNYLDGSLETTGNTCDH
ncbi:MAG: ATPase [Gemmatimonadaceae bacterium 4484_173]|nr:MAG: ATPase [Gemmatimonadaceae bacterium 4484_173]RKZ03936.1 MAG: ATPase [Candidatus Fermentibacteria bacterium]